MWVGDYGFLLRKMVLKEFKVRYRNMSLGIFWSLLNPLVMVGILTFVFTRLMTSDIVHFPVFVLCGLVPFSFFTQTWSISTAAVVENANVVKRTLVPREILLLSSVLASSLHLVMQIALLLSLALLAGIRPSWPWLWIPALGVLELFFVAGMGFVTSALQVYVRDIRYVVESACTVLFWLVPIFYSFASIPPKYAGIYQFNPLAALTLALRSILLDAQPPSEGLLLKLATVSVLTFGLGWLVFGKLKPRFYDYL